MSGRRLTLVLSITGLAACYQAQPLTDVSMLEDLRAARTEGPATAPGVASADGPLSEESAIFTAMAHNPELVAERVGIPIAEAKVRQAATWRNPQFHIHNEDPLDPFERERLVFGVRWYPPNPAVQLAKEEAAQSEVPYAEATVAEREWAIRHQARVAYLRALHAHGRALLAGELVKLRRQLADLSKVSVEKGLADPADAMSAELAVAEAEESKARAETAEFGAKAMLASLLGMAGPEGITLRSPAEDFACQAPTATERALEDSALDQHPRLRQARAAYARAEAELRMEYNKRVPWLDYVQVGYEHEPAQGMSGVRFGVGIDVPILDWNLGGVALGKARRDQQAARFREALSTVVGTIRGSVQRWRDAAGRLVHIQTGLQPLALEAVRTAGDAVASGRHPQRALLDAREREIATRAARLDTALACREAALDAEFASGSPLVPPM